MTSKKNRRLLWQRYQWIKGKYMQKENLSKYGARCYNLEAGLKTSFQK